MTDEFRTPIIAIYASPRCCEKPQLRCYKSYFNVAWFVRAYTKVLSKYGCVVTTDETFDAVSNADRETEKDYKTHWGVPEKHVNLYSLGKGFDAQVRLAAMVARGDVERLLLFQDPLDIQDHLPEMYALIRNCTLADVGLHINAGATFWAEAEWKQKKLTANSNGFGTWRNPEGIEALYSLLNPLNQTIAFISHDKEKTKMSQLIYHYREQFRSSDLNLTGTSGTCEHARKYLADRVPPYEHVPVLLPAGSSPSRGHGPTGGDVIIADRIIEKWRVDSIKEKRSNRNKEPNEFTPAHEFKPSVRKYGVKDTVVFFIDHRHAQPHEADIHVLLRTCLHPSHGVNLILNERTAIDWAETLRYEILTVHGKKESA